MLWVINIDEERIFTEVKTDSCSLGCGLWIMRGNIPQNPLYSFCSYPGSEVRKRLEMQDINAALH